MSMLLRFVRTSAWNARTLRMAISSRQYATPWDSTKMPTDEEQATGLERKELEANLAGNDDPFRFKVTPENPGTKEKPKLVPSMYDERIVGCICNEDTRQIVWMIVKEGPAQRCNCGHYFQLVKGNPIDIDVSLK